MTTNLRLGDVKENLTDEQKDIFAIKLAFVKAETKRLIFETNPGLVSFSFSIGKNTYERILNTRDTVRSVVGVGINENIDLIYELSKIATDLANEVNGISNQVSSGEIESKEFIEEDDFIYSFRIYIQNLAYEQLKDFYPKGLDIKQVYIYNDLPIYKKLKDFLASRQYKKAKDIAPKEILEQNNEKVELFNGRVIYLSREFKKGIDEIVGEFVEYYKKNEQLFISRFNFNTGLGEVAGYIYDEAERTGFFEKK